MPVSSWSPVAASNAGILTGITLDGSSMNVPLLDDAFREMGAQIAAQLGKVGFKGADMPSAATTDLSTATGWYCDVTGTTTITSLGSVDAGQVFILRFASSLVLTHNSSTLILPGAASLYTTGGDVAIMVSLGAGAWRCVNYLRAAGDVPIGSVIDYAGATAPTGWLLCYGQAVSRATYAGLFAAISTTYGVGDGSTTFNLPDLRGRVTAGQDDMGGTSANRLTGVTGSVNGDTMGASGGTETHTLTTAELAVHTHTATDTAHTHTFSDTSAGAVPDHNHTYTYPLSFVNGVQASGGSGINFWSGTQTAGTSGASVGHTHVIGGTTSSVNLTITNANAGSGSAHNNVQPTTIVNKIIKF